MKQETKWIDPLKRLIKDHEEVSEYLENFEEILGFLYKKETWRKIKPVEDFFKRNVISHFEFEEKIVFPAILSGAATPKSVKLILELHKEHETILRELKEFGKIISENTIPPDKEGKLKLNAVGKRIIDSLLKHAAKEDDNLLPILEKNRKIFRWL